MSSSHIRHAALALVVVQAVASSSSLSGPVAATRHANCNSGLSINDELSDAHDARAIRCSQQQHIDARVPRAHMTHERRKVLQLSVNDHCAAHIDHCAKI